MGGGDGGTNPIEEGDDRECAITECRAEEFGRSGQLRQGSEGKKLGRMTTG